MHERTKQNGKKSNKKGNKHTHTHTHTHERKLKKVATFSTATNILKQH